VEYDAAKAIADYTDEELRNAPSYALVDMRARAAREKDQAAQNRVAGYEHRDYVKQSVEENPLMAIPMALAAPVYQAVKALPKSITGNRSRSEPSLDQLGKAYSGILAGLGVQSMADGGLVLPAGLTPAMLTRLEQTRGLDQGLLDAVLHTESRGNPNAVSPKGAQGIAQLMPKTAAMLGVDPRNPREAVVGAADYLAKLLKQYKGHLPTALAAWNWGPGNVARKGVENMPEETRNFIKKVTTRLAPAQQPVTPTTQPGTNGVKFSPPQPIGQPLVDAGDQDEDYSEIIAQLLAFDDQPQEQVDEESA
jgi:soluble lytic murein transglycosylase-like protein